MIHCTILMQKHKQSMHAHNLFKNYLHLTLESLKSFEELDAPEVENYQLRLKKLSYNTTYKFDSQFQCYLEKKIVKKICPESVIVRC